MSTAEQADVAEHLMETVQENDEEAFSATFAPDVDPEFVAMLWTNLGLIDLSLVEEMSDGTWRVHWKVPGEQGVATHLIAADVQCDSSGCLIAGLGQSGTSPEPIWLVEPISIQHTAYVALVGGGDLAGWQVPAGEASAFLMASPTDELVQQASTQVVEVPGSTEAFEKVMGASALDFADAGAITWVANSGGDEDTVSGAPPRVVINPDATQDADETSRNLLLVHELTHAATSWLGHPADGQLWVSEGLAEHMMLQSSDAATQASNQVLLDHCPLSDAPPADADFADPSKNEFAYAWSAAAINMLLAERDTGHSLQYLWITAGEQPELTGPLADCG